MDKTDEEFLDSADLTAAKSDGLESLETASKKYNIDFVAPVALDCKVCGESLSNTQDWLLHHFTEWHRRVVKWVDMFRTKCIDQHDEDATTSFIDPINAVKDTVLYTQELFEIDGRLFCCSCACEVINIASHLGSARHNELALSIVDSSAFIKIKTKCLKSNSNSVNDDLYRNEILTWLAEELPPTADSPLEVVVLKKDQNFMSWFDKYCRALNNVVDAHRSNATTENRDFLLWSLHPSASGDSESSGHTESAAVAELFGGGSTVEQFVAQPLDDAIMDLPLENATAVETDFGADEPIIVEEWSEQDTIAGVGAVPESEMAEPPDDMAMDLAQSEDPIAAASCGSNIENENWTVDPAAPTKSDENGSHVETTTLLDRLTAAQHIDKPSRSPAPNSVTTAADSNACTVCDVKYFSRSIYLKHTETDGHAGKMKVHNFLNSENKYVVGAEPATVQAQFDSSLDRFIGLNEMYEMYHPTTQLRFWICGLCYCGAFCATTVAGHLHGIKHKKRYIECRYPEKKRRITTKNEMAEWMDQVMKEIVALEGKGKLKHALIVIDDISDLLKALGHSIAKTEEVSTENAESKPEQELNISSASIETGTSVVETKPLVAEVLSSDNLANGKLQEKQLLATSHSAPLSASMDGTKLEAKRHGTKGLSCKSPPASSKPDSAKTSRNGSVPKSFAGLVSSEWNAPETKKNDAKKDQASAKPAEDTDETGKDVVIVGEIKKLTPATNTKAASQSSPKDSKKAAIDSTPTKLPKVSDKEAVERKKGTRFEPPTTLSSSGAVTTTTLMDSLVTKMAASSAMSDTKASSSDKREWICIWPIHDRIGESDLEKILLKFVPEKVKDLSIKKSDGRRCAVMNAGKSAPSFITKLDRNTFPGYTQKLTVEYVNDPKVTESVTVDDVAVKLLMGSPSATIPIRYHAFAQPVLDECKEPLVGVEEIYEFCSRDLTYEPAYLCKLCRIRCNCVELISHLTSVDHRLKYFEKKNPAIYHSLTAGTSPAQKSVLQALAIKQHAQTIELQEGRARISQRLSIQVDPIPYGMKKNAIAAAAQAKTPSLQFPSAYVSSHSRVTSVYTRPLGLSTTPSALQPKSQLSPVLPPGVSASDNASSTSSLLDRVTAPYNNAPLPPGVEDRLPTLLKTRPKLPTEQTAWNAQCDRFLARLSWESPKKGSSGTKDSPKSSAAAVHGKKPDDSAKRSKESREEAKKTDSKSGERSMDRSFDRRSGHSSMSRSRQSRSRSRSRNRSRGKETSKSTSSKSPTKKAKSKSPKRKSKSPVASKKDKGTKRRSKSPEKSPKKKARLESKSEKHAASRTDRKSGEFPDLLVRLTEQLAKSDRKKAEPAKPSSSESAFEALLARVLAERAAASSSASTSTASTSGAVGQLLAMLDKGKTETAKPSRPQTPATGMGVIMKMLAEEEERQRKQQQQHTALMALLSSKLGTGSTSSTSGGGPMVIEYGHGSQNRQGQKIPNAQPGTVSSFVNRVQQMSGDKADPADDLVNEAMRNVMRAQAASSSVQTSTSVGPRPTFFQWDVNRPPPPRSQAPPPPFGAFRSPMPAAFPNQASANPQAAALVNAAAAMLLTSFFSPAPPRG